MSDAAVKLAATQGGVADDAKAAGKVVGDAFESFDFAGDKIGDFALAFDSVAEKEGKAGKVLNDTLLDSLQEAGGVTDVPPTLSSTPIWSPIPEAKEIGREEAFQRRTDHRLPA